jgi:hypothetical protein
MALDGGDVGGTKDYDLNLVCDICVDWNQTYLASTSSRLQNRQSRKSGCQAPAGDVLAGHGSMEMAKSSPSNPFANLGNSDFQAMK